MTDEQPQENARTDAAPADADAEVTGVKPAAAPAEPAAPAGSVFAGWGFDVNAVTTNLNTLFAAAPDAPPDEPEEAQGARAAPEEQLARSATHMAQAAGAELEHASKAAQATIGAAAEEIGRGWGSLNTFLDDMLAAKPDERSVPDAPSDGADVHRTFHELFPDLDQEDEVVDHFQCALVQKYRCYLNNATPEKAFPLHGRLFVSTSHIAMYVTDDGGVFGREPFGISVPFSDVGKIQKGAKTMLRLVTKSSSSFIFANFESDSHFSGALSLLEHMAGAAQVPPPPADAQVSEETPAKD